MYEIFDDFEIDDDMLDDIGSVSNLAVIQRVVDRFEQMKQAKESLGAELDKEIEHLSAFMH